jgi:hypothetical protein
VAHEVDAHYFVCPTPTGPIVFIVGIGLSLTTLSKAGETPCLSVTT